MIAEKMPLPSSQNVGEPLQFYTAQKHHFTALAAAHENTIRHISIMRFVSAAIITLSGYASWIGGISAIPFLSALFWNGALILSFAAFLVLLTRHAKHFAERDYAETMGNVQEREIQVLLGNMSAIPNGGEFLSEQELLPEQAENFALDLDIFGENSLFQRINRTVTPLGYVRLAEHLTSTLENAQLVRKRQEALTELATETTFRHEWKASHSKRHLTGLEQEGLQRWLNAQSLATRRDSTQQTWFQALLWIMPLLTLACCIVGFIKPESGAMQLFGAFVLGQFCIWALYIPRIRREAATMSRTGHLLAVYVRLFRLAQKYAHFRSPALQRCATEADSAVKSIGKLTRLLRASENGQSFLGAIVLNGLLLWDLQCVSRLAAWRKVNSTRVELWFDMIAEMDALVSMAGFVFNHPHFLQPTILDESSPSLDASDLAHPFLPRTEAVRNSVRISNEAGNLVVITGANMAGKSTFLRALALNVAIALMGLPVCAEEFSCSVMHIVTSMRTSDSLERHESYFFAELQRLKMIIERLRSGEQMLVVLDEILRGTNSDDKRSGTKGVLRQLLSFSCLAVIATHDIEIGALEQDYPNQVRNYCFEGTIEGDELYFDYALRKGVACNKNATFLMQKMGIVQPEM